MILNTLADFARVRVEQLKKDKSLAEIKEAALAQPIGDFIFEKALKNSAINIIAEIKRLRRLKELFLWILPRCNRQQLMKRLA